MILRRRKAEKATDLHSVSRKAASRMDRLATADVIAYGDNSCSEINKMLRAFQQSGERAVAEEAYRQALVLLAAVEALRLRAE